MYNPGDVTSVRPGSRTMSLHVFASLDRHVFSSAVPAVINRWHGCGRKAAIVLSESHEFLLSAAYGKTGLGMVGLVRRPKDPYRC